MYYSVSPRTDNSLGCELRIKAVYDADAQALCNLFLRYKGQELMGSDEDFYFLILAATLPVATSICQAIRTFGVICDAYLEPDLTVHVVFEHIPSKPQVSYAPRSNIKPPAG